MSTGTIFSHKNIPFPPKKRYIRRSAWCSTVQGSTHSWTLKKKHSFEHSFSPPTQLSPLRIGCLVGCRVGCCVVVMVLLLSFFTLLPHCQHRLPPPPSARHHRRHCRWLARRMTPATQMPTAARRRNGNEGGGQLKAEATKRAITTATRMASNDNGDGVSGKSNGDGKKGAG
jgi:hypothetical protein